MARGLIVRALTAPHASPKGQFPPWPAAKGSGAAAAMAIDASLLWRRALQPGDEIDAPWWRVACGVQLVQAWRHRQSWGGTGWDALAALACLQLFALLAVFGWLLLPLLPWRL